MRQFHVISVSIGTGLLLCMLTVFLVLALAFAMMDVHSKTPPSPSFHPQNGVLGEIEHQINDLKYGPVNTDATKQVKNGLFDRIRANRQARVCGSPVSQQSVCAPQSIVYQSQFVQPSFVQYQLPSVRIIDPSDCNYSYSVTNPVMGQTMVTQSTGFEMPSASPINPLEPAISLTVKDCANCKTSQRNAVKTGSFICSNCRKSKIGEWHTDWNSDGTPVTFLCESCHSFMTPEQRERAFTAYQARQFGKAGRTGLLHQEIGQ